MGTYSISGLSGSRVAPICSKIIKQRDGHVLVVASNFIRAEQLAMDISFFIDKKTKVYLLPSDGETFAFYDAKNKDALYGRLDILRAINSKEKCVIVAPVNAAIKKMPPKQVFFNKNIYFELNRTFDRYEDLAMTMVSLGYERVPMVYGKGQFSLRGSILDVYVPYEDDPYRIEFFDDEVESIRSFDVESQTSISKFKNLEICPAELIIRDNESFARAKAKISSNYKNLTERKEELIRDIDNLNNLQQLENYMEYFYEASENIFDYMGRETIILENPARVFESIESRDIEYKMDFTALLEKGKVVKKDFDNFPGEKDLIKLFNCKNSYFLMPFQKAIKGIEKYTKIENISSMEGLLFNGNMPLLEKEIKKYSSKGYEITIACATEERLNNLKKFMEERNLINQVKLKLGYVSEGMEFPREKILLITDKDIFGTQKKKKPASKSKKTKAIKSFTEIRNGDFVVHENHGVGKYLGIKKLELQGIQKDYIHIKYAGNDTLYVPVEQMDMVQKYIGSDAYVPKINKLSGAEWKSVKAKAKAAVAEMAKELLEISAARAASSGFQFSEDTPWQKEFEEAFPYEETKDQLRCIEEIKNDMESPTVMERLLCGDVGYGKTEVAARAMFKAVCDGKQVAMLVPTTVLANQHYNTIKARFAKYPFRVEMLSRFRTPEQQKLIIEETKRGNIDVLIGTHRLLSEDVKYKDLGLLVIDEEQRFGVAHKEKIKQIRANLDVLLLSATPIPRTLHMSLVGIRDISIIEEPPQERFPVQTYVMEEDDFIMREAIERELGRGGQVFVVFNKVRGIKRIAGDISKLVPGKKVLIAHGQMGVHELEEVMMNFVAGQGDILVATTIIESGIDIPNVNTEIIIDADHFGLSQLYQLRGRVGRSNKLGYAYLMYKKAKTLTEISEKRLRAIKEFTEFGAGFKIAMRDLELRGAGNILGTEQHGHLISVGYELYCKLVDEAVAALKGEIIKDEKTDTVLDIKVPAYIPDSYISEEVSKLTMYRRIAEIETSSDRMEMLKELEDRFGNAPREVINLLDVAIIKHLAQNMGFAKVSEDGDKIVLDSASKNTKPIIVYRIKSIPVLEDIRDLLEKMGKK
ncbi:MAG: transcription-repair coupling factor [Anaerovoracaceae bacterium]